jgi:ABC-2 type transport system permease protein
MSNVSTPATQRPAAARPNYLRIWLACARYSVVRAMMFRMDFLMWTLVEFLWMGVNVAMVAVIYLHTDSIGGWSQYEMLLLIGTSMIIQRLMMGFFWSNIFEFGRNVRTGHFDFFLAQPGNILFMVSTRKLDLDGLANVFVAVAVVIYSAGKLGLQPGALDIAAYILLLACGLVVNYSLIVLAVSLTFWIIKTEGVEGSWFALTEFSRLPREVFRGLTKVVFVYALPAVIVTNIPARTLLDGINLAEAAWLAAVSAVWFGLAVLVFHRGLRRYASASS